MCKGQIFDTSWFLVNLCRIAQFALRLKILCVFSKRDASIAHTAESRVWVQFSNGLFAGTTLAYKTDSKDVSKCSCHICLMPVLTVQYHSTARSAVAPWMVFGTQDGMNKIHAANDALGQEFLMPSLL
eukprot:5530754-Amphidinium_carterae.1